MCSGRVSDSDMNVVGGDSDNQIVLPEISWYHAHPPPPQLYSDKCISLIIGPDYICYINMINTFLPSNISDIN